MQVIRASEYKRMPWKNGGGETVEIAVSPHGASVNDFDWRISMATVASDGPFSIFSGIDRTLSILSGDGMSLSIDGSEPNLLTQQSQPLGFAADVPVDATLVEGPITDLNVMTRRSRFSHRVERMSGAFSVEAPARGETVLLLSTQKISVETGGETIVLDALDTILFSAKASVKAGNIVCYVVRLSGL